MSITPTEGQVAAAGIEYAGLTRVPDMEIGLFAGTWDDEYDVTYAEATARFTKLTGNGMDPRTLPDIDAVINEVGDTVQISWPAEIFAATAPVTINGYYIAYTVDGSTVLETVERDPTQRDLGAGESYTVTPNIVLRDA